MDFEWEEGFLVFFVRSSDGGVKITLTGGSSLAGVCRRPNGTLIQIKRWVQNAPYRSYQGLTRTLI